MENEANLASDGKVWYSVLDTVMKIPGAKVDRRAFLKNNFSKYYDDDKLSVILEEGTGRAGVPIEIMDKVADRVISYHLTWVTLISAGLGFPGGFALIGTIPTDLAQYFLHTFQVAQKLAYVYGYPDLDEGSDDDLKTMITLFVGVMFGVAAANAAIKAVAKMFAQATVKRLSSMALTKTTIYPIVKQIARVLGIQLTKKKFAEWVGKKLIPIISAGISGGITWATFLPNAKRLKKKLREDIIT